MFTLLMLFSVCRVNQCNSLACLLPTSANCAKMLAQKDLLKRFSCFDFSSSNFNLQNHILNTIGVALSGFLSVYTGDALGEPAPTLIPHTNTKIKKIMKAY